MSKARFKVTKVKGKKGTKLAIVRVEPGKARNTKPLFTAPLPMAVKLKTKTNGEPRDKFKITPKNHKGT